MSIFSDVGSGLAALGGGLTSMFTSNSNNDLFRNGHDGGTSGLFGSSSNDLFRNAHDGTDALSGLMEDTSSSIGADFDSSNALYNAFDNTKKTADSSSLFGDAFGLAKQGFDKVGNAITSNPDLLKAGASLYVGKRAADAADAKNNINQTIVQSSLDDKKKARQNTAIANSAMTYGSVV